MNNPQEKTVIPKAPARDTGKKQNFKPPFVAGLGVLVFGIAILPGVIFSLVPDYEWALMTIICLYPLLVTGILLATFALCDKNLSLREKLQINFPGKKNFLPSLLAALLFFLAAGMISIILALIMEKLAIDYPKPQIAEMFKKASLLQKYIIILAAVILAPTAEELLFRHVIYRFLKDHCGIACAFAVTSVCFALLHDCYIQYPGLLLLGIFFQFAYVKYKSLIVPIYLHACNNAFAVICLLLTT